MKKVKTTYDNPASFKKSSRITLIGITKKIVRKQFNGHNHTIKFLISEISNYFNQLKIANRFYCNLCKKGSPFFLHTSNDKRILRDSICPNCSSRKRHRGLFEEYKTILNSNEINKILHFAPEPVFYSLFQNYDYITADFNLEDVDLKLDIQKIDYKSESFDLILCNHVLEHVEKDFMALEELERILKPNGILLLTVPGDWERDEIIEFNKPDGNGHYRDYGLDLISILKDNFSKVDLVDLFKYNNVYNLPIDLTPKHDLAFLCHKV